MTLRNWDIELFRYPEIIRVTAHNKTEAIRKAKNTADFSVFDIGAVTQEGRL